MEKKTTRSISRAKFLGDFVLTTYQFEGIDSAFEAFHSKDFTDLSSWQKEDKINVALLHLIQSASGPAFLLIPALSFIDRIVRENIFEAYSFASFELWINHHANLSADENYQVRGKKVGKYVPRNE